MPKEKHEKVIRTSTSNCLTNNLLVTLLQKSVFYPSSSCFLGQLRLFLTSMAASVSTNMKSCFRCLVKLSTRSSHTACFCPPTWPPRFHDYLLCFDSVFGFTSRSAQHVQPSGNFLVQGHCQSKILQQSGGCHQFVPLRGEVPPASNDLRHKMIQVFPPL